jgi:hypothetical protein
MLLTSRDDVFEEFEYVEEKHRVAREAAGVQIDRRTFSRWVALGHRRAGRRFRAAGIYLDAFVRNGDAGSLARAVVAPLGERPVSWLRPLRLSAPGVEAAGGPGEPEWLGLYR